MASSVFCFCLGAGVALKFYSRLFNTKCINSNNKEKHLLKYDETIVPDDFVNGFYFVDGGFPCNASSTPLTRELASTLNMMDRSIKSKELYGNWMEYNKRRWDVMEDSKALYILRYMSGLDIKDVTENVELPSVDKAILVLKYVGKVGSNDSVAYPGYTVDIDLPGTFYKISDVKIDLDVKCKVLKITIPKEEGKSNDKISCKTKIDQVKHFYPYEVFEDRERSRTKLGATRFPLIV